MDATLLISYVATSFVFIVLLFIIFNSNKKKKNLPPSGPPALPIIGHLYLLQKPLHQTLARLASRHGSLLLLRFGIRSVLVVSSASLANECFTKNDLAFATRPKLSSTSSVSYNNTTVGTSPYGEHWRNIRRISTVEILSATKLNALSAARDAEVRFLVRRLFQSSDSRGEEFRTVELIESLFGLTLNVITGMLTGKRYYGEQEEGSSVETRIFQEMVEKVFSTSGASNVTDFLPEFLQKIDFTGSKKKTTKLAALMDKFMQGIIEENKKPDNSSGEKTMVGYLLDMQQKDPKYYTDEIIKALFVSFLLAGTDTSAHTMEWAMSHLLNNPEVLKKARAEIDTYVGSDRLLEEQDMANLPYLHAIVNETLRISPTAPLLLPHQSREGSTLGGYTIPPDTMILINAWAIHRDPNLWPEPTKFMPERFLPENGKGDHGPKIIPFGMGRRRCPGESLARRVLPLALASMIQCFEWERVGGGEVDMAEAAAGQTLLKAIPLQAMFKPRKIMIDVLSGL